jgi:CDP-6-deoxy-D-xylo-4-hexulose-3-dehydrase
VLSNSGTSSLLVALQTLKKVHGWQKGDEVLVPALTFVATVNVVLQARLKPVLVDIEPDYYGIDVNQIEKAITRKARCIIPVHTFGQSTNFLFYGLPNSVKVIEDSCEAMLVKHYGRVVGSWGDIACFSTYAAHLLVTGVGGLSITNNQEYALHMRSLVNHGIDLTELPTGTDYDPTWLARKFRFSRIGHSFRVTELEAALGLAQLDDLGEMIKTRQANAAYLTGKLRHLEDRIQLPAIRPNTEHSFMMFPLVCKQEGDRDKLCHYLAQNGIETRLMLPLTNQPAYVGLWREDDYPIAKWINNNGFYLGCHHGLTFDDMDWVAEKIGEYYQ